MRSPPSPPADHRGVDRLRAAAVGGVVGPVAFLAAWAVGGAITDGYDPFEDAISRLAAVGAETRVLMTAGFMAFSVGVGCYARSAAALVSRPAAFAAAVSALATLGVAALPLDRSPGVDTAHGWAAGVGYAALASTPLLASFELRRRRAGWLATTGAIAGTVAAAALAVTTVTDVPGLFQRLGLTIADAWVAASAMAIATGRLGPRPPAVAGGQ